MSTVIRPSLDRGFGRTIALLGLLGLGLAACGGGGGGGGGPSLPGALVALAVQAQPAPDTSGGNFGAFPVQPVMSTATGPWSAFVAPVVGGNTSSVLYVAQPDGTRVRVFAQGEQLPGGSTETIASIDCVWMRPAGVVLAYVSLTGGTDTFAVLSAVVFAGAASQHTIVLRHNMALPVAGTLDSIEEMDAQVADTGAFWCLGQSSTGNVHLFSVNADGTTLAARVSPGSPLPGGVDVVAIGAIGLDDTGTQFAFVASTTAGESRIYNGQPGAPAYIELMQEGDVLASGSIDDIHAAGPLIVYSAGDVVWMAVGSASAVDQVLLLANGLNAVQLARAGDVGAGTGGGLVSNLRLLPTESDQQFPQYLCDVSGGTVGTTVAIYGLISLQQAPALAMYDGRPAPGGGDFGATFPSLLAQKGPVVSRNADLFFANILSTGVSGLFWLRVNVGLFTVAAQGGIAPGGDTFGAFHPQAAFTISVDVVLFRAALAGAGTGIFRHG
jgi:hypothetical protein